MLDQEKPLIAGVYANRLDPKKWPLGLLQSDPTIFYVHDSLELAKIPVDEVDDVRRSGRRSRAGSTDETLPADLAGYNTYTSKGLPPGPIDTPTLTSIDAALEPDTKDGYLYFLAKGDGTGTTAFAKTLKEHQANVKKYIKPHAMSPPAGTRALAGPGRLRGAAVGRRSRRAGTRRIGPRDRPVWHGCGRGSRRPASTPTSASDASTCAT